jgi:hypothetical protein
MYLLNLVEVASYKLMIYFDTYERHLDSIVLFGRAGGYAFNSTAFGLVQPTRQDGLLS